MATTFPAFGTGIQGEESCQLSTPERVGSFGILGPPVSCASLGPAMTTMPIWDDLYDDLSHDAAQNTMLAPGLQNGYSHPEGDVSSHLETTAHFLGGSKMHSIVRSSEPDRQRNSRGRSKIDHSTKKQLLCSFQNNPYPSGEEVMTLAKALHLPAKTIQTWFNNHRTRNQPSQSRTAASEDSVSASGTTPVTQANIISLQQHIGSNQDDENVSMLSRFMESPLDQDPELMALYSHADIATNSSSIPMFDVEYVNTKFSSQNVCQSPESASGGEASTSSVRSWNSACSATSRNRRRGRRRHLKTRSIAPTRQHMELTELTKNTPPYVVSSTATICKYRCTFCASKFGTRYSWLRHEQGVHASTKVYVCKFDLSEAVTQALDDDVYLPLVSSALECHNKPLDQRVFNRPDHLAQHIRRTHLINHKDGRSDAWIRGIVARSQQSLSIPTDHPSLKCGFCAETMSTLDCRMSHVGDHFANDTHLSNWWLGRKAIQVDFSKRSRQWIWSCAHLAGPRDAFWASSPGQSTCLYCAMTFAESDDWASRFLHLQQAHRYRCAEQCAHSSRSTFSQHLKDIHCFDGLPYIYSPFANVCHDRFSPFVRLYEKTQRISEEANTMNNL